MFVIPDSAICIYGHCTIVQNWVYHIIVEGANLDADSRPLGPRPVSGPLDRFGERTCVHWGIDLSTSIGRLENTRNTGSPNFPFLEAKFDEGPNTTPFWEHIDYFIGVGEDFSKTWINDYDNQIHHGKWVGDALFVVSYDGSSPNKSYQHYGSIKVVKVGNVWYGCGARNSVSVPPSDPRWIKGGATDPFGIQWTPVYWPTTSTLYRRKSRRLISGTKASAKDDGALSSAITRALSWSRLAVREEDLFDWNGTLSQAAAEQCRELSTNMFSLIPELLRLRSGVSSLIDQLKRTATKRTLRSLADLELSLQYGVRLTLIDVLDQAKRVTQRRTTLLGDCRARSMVSHTGTANVRGNLIPYQIDYHLKVWYDPTPDDPVHRAIWSLLSKKMLPTLADTWDLVPYSFVLDWLLNLGDTLDQVDARTLISALQVDCALYSRKLKFNVNSSLIPDLNDYVQGVVGFSDYIRYKGDLVPPQPSFTGFQKFHNVVEASAILIQKLRR